MKIITYSDLHLEFGGKLIPAPQNSADLMVLAGDIITFGDYEPLVRFMQNWKKPVLYVAGNHEYYTQRNMQAEAANFTLWLADQQPHVHFLQDEAVTIDGVQFFGGTMWTDFAAASASAMTAARRMMNDFRYIMSPAGRPLLPSETVQLHEIFVNKMLTWFEQDLSGSRLVITHHAPVVNPDTKHGDSPLSPAFNSLDMVEIIKKYQPRLWIYGHTHECDNQLIGKTQIISNQSGYPTRDGGYECEPFDDAGLMVEIK